MYLEEHVQCINEKLLCLRDKHNIVIWGGAENTAKLFQYTDILNYDIGGIVDKGRAGNQFYGSQLQSPADMEWTQIEAVVISSFHYEDEIEEELKNKFHFAGLIIKLKEQGQIIPFYHHLSKADIQAPEDYRELLERNKRFKGIHKNERLFILCSGPSIREMDLTVLKNEITMAVHSFYLHKDISVIQPEYYCNAQWEYNEKTTEKVSEAYLKDLKMHVGKSQYFFSLREKGIIDRMQNFDSEEVNYYCYGKDSSLYEEVDLCQGIMPVHSVPVICIQLAIYMGFKEIYLLGTEHDFLTTKKYAYFYDRKQAVTGDTDITTDADSNLVMNFSDAIADAYALWNNYKVVRRIAQKNDIKIYNATMGGALDLFPRVDFNSLF